MVHACTDARFRRAVLAVSALFLTLAVVGVAPHAARAATVARGIADPTLTEPGARMGADVQTEAIEQIGSSNLRASYVRFVVSWAAAEPNPDGSGGEAYLAGVDKAVELAKANGLKVIITFAWVPQWASDPAFWDKNPYTVKGYDRRYAMKTDVATLAAFQEFCRKMASRFHAWGYECWNEPNLHLTLYPQSTAKDKDFGAHVYIKMLRKFSAGIHAGDPQAVRMAGGTAPRGFAASAPLARRAMMTSPQRFARQIKAHGVSSLFDAYSHHPYTPGASGKNSPEAPPRDPTTTVNLQNLGTLLAIFPTKPFYLTEYGYQTAPCTSFTWQFVSLTKQADYLRRAYAYARRYRQVKLLMWFLLDDYSPTGDPTERSGLLHRPP